MSAGPEDSAEWRVPLSLACSKLEAATSNFERAVDSDGPRKLVMRAAQRNARRADPGRGRILLVEDDYHLGRSLRTELEYHGLAVVLVTRYEDACARLVEPWEALVADILLEPPHSAAELYGQERPTGLDLVRQALAAEVRRVVLITGWSDGAELERIRADSGAHVALAKPFEVSALLTAIRPPIRDAVRVAV